MASIKQLPNGRYQARYRDDARREHARNFRLKREAQRWLDEQTAAIVSGQWVDPSAGAVSFRTYFDDWSTRQIWVESTARNAELAVKSFPDSDLPIKSIRRSQVEAWVKSMATATEDRKAYAPTTITTRFVCIRQVFQAAVRDRVIAVDPTDGVKLPRKQKAEERMTIPEPGDVQKLLSGADDDFHAFIALCAFSGLRRGEAAGVQVSDVDFLRRVLHVRRQVQRFGGTVEVRAPKYGSVRDVPMPDPLGTLLAEHIRRYGLGLDDWLFVAEPGEPLHDNKMMPRWRKAERHAKVRINPHSLRHFFASGLIAAGCDVVTVQKAMGHRSATTTLTTYAHLWPSAEDRTRQGAKKVMSETLADAVRTIGDQKSSG